MSLGMATPRLFAGEKLAEPYENRKKEISTDILVVGGGTAGTIAAIQAARAGAKTVLVELGSQLGGTITSAGVSFPGIFHAWGKQVIGGIGWELVQECVTLNDDQLPNFSIPHGRNHPKHQVWINGPLFTLLAEDKCLEAGVELRFYETPYRIKFKKDRWIVETVGKGTHTKITCKQLIDCTGNALVTSMAGFDVLREAETQPGTLLFTLEGYDKSKLNMDHLEHRYTEELKKGDMVREEFRSIQGVLNSNGYTFSGHVLGADSTTSETHTATNINGRRALYKMLRFLRTLPGCEHTRVVKVQTETGVRETYRIDGLHQVTQSEYVNGKVFEDAISYAYYPIDIHDKTGVHPENLAENVVATIPLRALIPRGSKNLLVAGRCLSSDRGANSALRVQAPCMSMGQAAAAAAVLASRSGKTPAEVPLKDIRHLLEEHGAIIPS
ncbi:MAG: FAD-dependent oxidoreductase [Bacteroidales bacterium]|nr:FAD-dependent oxidoreductase [Bacteroidales bacterium]